MTRPQRERHDGRDQRKQRRAPEPAGGRTGPDADLSYAKLGSYATTHEISVDGPLREYYLHGAGDTPDEAQWRTEIGWPIFRADASRAF